MGKDKWLTVASPDELGGTQLLLEADDNPAAKTYQQEIYRQARSAPGATFAVLDDTCGNLIQLTQMGT